MNNKFLRWVCVVVVPVPLHLLLAVLSVMISGLLHLVYPRMGYGNLLGLQCMASVFTICLAARIAPKKRRLVGVVWSILFSLVYAFSTVRTFDESERFEVLIAISQIVGFVIGGVISYRTDDHGK